MIHIPANARLKLKFFGMASIVKMIYLRETKETVYDVKCDSGQILCLTKKYVGKVLDK